MYEINRTVINNYNLCWSVGQFYDDFYAENGKESSPAVCDVDAIIYET